ncbi:hypothetical protein 65p223 [Aeromonas phage 65]|uniref:Uncharacterized protein n=2 Tax=Ishigurovirus osborne TaxID=260149 RepID=A0A219YCD8_9CAUD|nr:hypothetical protein ST65p223 [Aeromonas phage 65]ADQ53231.1 hypothetical protein 65p223 [Aeromonas phage 65]APU01607.1 hypothetical protein [Aeromonas phage 65.2]
MKDIAIKFKNLFASRGHIIDRVQVIYNVDGKCEGRNMVCVFNQDINTLMEIRKDLSKAGGFSEMVIEKTIDWTDFDFVNAPEDAQVPSTFVLKAVVQES